MSEVTWLLDERDNHTHAFHTVMVQIATERTALEALCGHSTLRLNLSGPAERDNRCHKCRILGVISDG